MLDRRPMEPACIVPQIGFRRRPGVVSVAAVIDEDDIATVMCQFTAVEDTIGAAAGVPAKVQDEPC